MKPEPKEFDDDFFAEEEILLPRNITFKVSYNNDREEYTLTAMGRTFNR